MERIIIRSSHSGRRSELSALAKALFPECEISVVSERHENHGEHNSKTRFLKQDIGYEEGHIITSNTVLTKA